jgi:hypothetical protein
MVDASLCWKQPAMRTWAVYNILTVYANSSPFFFGCFERNRSFAPKRLGGVRSAGRGMDSIGDRCCYLPNAWYLQVYLRLLSALLPIQGCRDVTAVFVANGLSRSCCARQATLQRTQRLVIIVCHEKARSSSQECQLTNSSGGRLLQ